MRFPRNSRGLKRSRRLRNWRRRWAVLIDVIQQRSKRSQLFISRRRCGGMWIGRNVRRDALLRFMHRLVTVEVRQRRIGVLPSSIATMFRRAYRRTGKLDDSLKTLGRPWTNVKFRRIRGSLRWVRGVVICIDCDGCHDFDVGRTDRCPKCPI